MADIKDLERLKRLVESEQRQRDKAQGRYEAVMDELRREYGCDSLEDAEKLKKKLDRQAEAAKQEAERALAEFKREFGKELPPNEDD